MTTVILSSTDNIQELRRQRDHLEIISTVEFPHPLILSAVLVHDIVFKIAVKEAGATLKKMRLGKETGADDLPADLSMSTVWHPSEWLLSRFSSVVEVKKLP